MTIQEFKDAHGIAEIKLNINPKSGKYVGSDAANSFLLVSTEGFDPSGDKYVYQATDIVDASGKVTFKAPAEGEKPLFWLTNKPGKEADLVL